MMLKAFDLDTQYWSKDHLTKVLTSDLNDPASYVNTTTASNKTTLQALTAHFNFNASGTLDAGVSAQDPDQISEVVGAYLFYVPSRMVPAEAEANKAYYEANIGSVTNVDDLVNDSRMLSYIKTAFSLEDVTLKGAWTGPAALSFTPHALAPVAELPVLEIVSAVHLVCDLTLGLGKVAYDYLQSSTSQRAPAPTLAPATAGVS